MNRIIYVAIGMLAFACYSTASQAALISFTVDKATISKSTGAITVTGTIACTVGEAFNIYDSIVQVSGRKYSVANGSFSGTCTGNTEPWTNGESVLFGSIKTGNADVVVQIFESSGGFLFEKVFHQSISSVP